MADNVAITAGSGTTIATDDAGAGGHVQLVKLAISTDGSATLIPAEATNGLDVDVTRLPALVAGSANIGDVDVATIAAGDNNIGNVDVVTLPALVAGSANIGDVDVLSVPSDPFGANADASSTAGGVGTMQAKLRLMTTQLDGIKVALQLIDDAISGSEMQVDVLTLPGVAGDIAHDSADSGNPLKIGGKAAVAVPTAVAAADRVNAWLDLNGRQVVQQIADTATLSNVSGSASSVTVLASNTGRKGAVVVNDSTAVCYLKFGSTASATSFTYKMAPEDTLEVPFGYTGILTGLWTSATGSARVTEIT